MSLNIVGVPMRCDVFLFSIALIARSALKPGAG